MVDPTPLDAHRETALLAEKVAETCRRRLWERPHDPVPLAYIVAQTEESRPRVEAAVAWLQRAGRLHISRYAMRWRPHVAVEAVDRIDDLSVTRNGGGSSPA